MKLIRKNFSEKSDNDETPTQKINRRKLSNLVGISIAGTGSYLTKNGIDKGIYKINELKNLHKSRIIDKYEKIRDNLDKKTKEVLKEVNKKRTKTGNRLIDESNKIDDAINVQRAKFNLGMEIFKREAAEKSKVDDAASRLRKRALNKAGKKLALGIGASTLAGLGVKALIDKKLKERNKRINEEKRNRRKGL